MIARPNTMPRNSSELAAVGSSAAIGPLAEVIATTQLELEGTFTLHSKTAAKNGGDYDFDFVCVVEGDRFPRFVEHRFNYKGNGAVEKTNSAPDRTVQVWNPSVQV